MSGPTFGLPGGYNLSDTSSSCGCSDSGSGILKKLIVTSTQNLQDPSGGKAKWFRVSICGGGGGYLYDAANNYNRVGGGAVTCIRLFAPSEIAWPVQVTIGARGISCHYLADPYPPSQTNGGTTSFGSLFSASGGQCAGNTTDGGSGTNFYWTGRELLTVTSSTSSGVASNATKRGTGAAAPGVVMAPQALVYTGTGGQGPGIPGQSVLGILFDKSYGLGGTKDVQASSGVCIIEWEE